ncbi:MAG: Fpg/Nei family DNA glycosylase [Actinobacteria bacterium]|nr:Fpg/Nei family DNA glycosylase [Actinomycetota bacterium]MCG2802442.1 Fpg/Nei family DNA glycosylase [Cellulomonas sp.]
MPEGDVLRRTAASLDAALAGRRLVRADLRWPGLSTADLTDRTVLHTRPYGKHLLTRLDDGRTLHSHLRMDGVWRVVPTGSPRAAARSPRVRALLADDRSTALGVSLGMLDLVRTSDEHLLVAHLGPDILDERFENGGLAEAEERWRSMRATPVCDVLLDQRVVAGIGTIYLAESLFAERIHPWTPADEVDAGRVLLTARALMQRSVARGPGPGKVHSRAGLPCPRCGTTVQRGTARRPPQERPVFWCPVCQAAGTGSLPGGVADRRD